MINWFIDWLSFKKQNKIEFGNKRITRVIIILLHSHDNDDVYIFINRNIALLLSLLLFDKLYESEFI